MVDVDVAAACGPVTSMKVSQEGRTVERALLDNLTESDVQATSNFFLAHNLVLISSQSSEVLTKGLEWFVSSFSEYIHYISRETVQQR